MEPLDDYFERILKDRSLYIMCEKWSTDRKKNWTGFGKNLHLIWAEGTMVFAMHAQTA